MDIGIDFTVNTAPSRRVNLTDWESRLVEHCLLRYLEAAVPIEDATVPLAASALRKIRRGKVPGHSSPDSRQVERRHESRAVNDVLDRLVLSEADR